MTPELPQNLVKWSGLDLEVAGFPCKHVRGICLDGHTLRRLTATMIAMAGMSSNTTQANMRHSTIDLTMNTYKGASRPNLDKTIGMLPWSGKTQGSRPHPA